MAQVLAIEQQKGGVGKSDVAKNLAGAMQAAGRRVLVIDWDPQGDITRMLGLADAKPGLSLPAVLLGQAEVNDPAELVVPHSCGLHLIPNTLDMHTLEPAMYNLRAREGRLAALVRWLVAEDVYDAIVIDCPPALGLLVDNATAATDAGGPGSGVVVVAAPWPIIFGNLELLEMQLDAARTELGLRAPVVGLVVNLFAVQAGLMEVRSHDLLATRPDYLLTVRRRAVISEAAAAGQPVEVYDPGSDAAGWYRDLAAKVAPPVVGVVV